MAYIRGRESELLKDIAQTRAELQATMEALGHARAETEELRAWIEQVTAGS